MDTKNATRVGRPPTSNEVVARACELLAQKKSPKEVSKETGLGLTKVYEIRRGLQGAA